jgi:hypothetical protein
MTQLIDHNVQEGLSPGWLNSSNPARAPKRHVEEDHQE